MLIPVQYTVKYKYAPKAENASMLLGYIFIWSVLAIISIIWFGIVSSALTGIMDCFGMWPMIVAMVTAAPMLYLLFMLKRSGRKKYRGKLW